MATATLLTAGASGWNSAATASFTTASVSPGANCALVLLIGLVMDFNGTTNPFGVVATSSGSGPTWTERAGPTSLAGFTVGAQVQTATIGGTDPGSFTVTFNPSGSTNMGAYSYALYKVTGHDTGTPFGGKVATTGNAGDGAVTVTLDAAPASADITLALSHADGDSNGGAFAKGATFDTGWTEDADGTSYGAYHGWNCGQRTGSTSTSVPWTDVMVGSTENYSSGQAAIVVKADTSGVSGTVAVTLADFTSSASGGIEFIGTVATTLEDFAPTASGINHPTGTVAVTLDNFTSSASGTHTDPSRDGTVNVTLADFTSTASGTFTPLPITGTVAVTLGDFTSTATGTHSFGSFPYSVSGRKILDATGAPYHVKGIAAWTATQNLSNAEITTMLEGVSSWGFNSVMMAPCGLQWNVTGTNYPHDKYVNKAGQPFFATTAGGSTYATPFQNPMGAAWSSVDHFMNEALRLDITVFFTWYAGNGGAYGQADEWVAASDAQMRQHAADVASRYPASSYPNLVWVWSCDRNFNSASTVGLRLDSICRGVADVEVTRLTTAHPDKRDNGTYGSARQQFALGGYTYLSLDINAIYTYKDALVDEFDAVWGEAVMPTINIEPVYVHNTDVTAGTPSDADISHGTGQGQHLREQAWATLCRGGQGLMHGDEDFWPFDATGLYSGGATWEEVLSDAVGTHDKPVEWLSYVWDFINLHPEWADFNVDDTTVNGFNILVNGWGSGTTKAAAVYSGTLCVIYFPTSSGRSAVDAITLRTSIMTGTGNVRLRWLDPTNGNYTTISASEAQSTSRALTYPALNSNGNSSDDWVLVIDLTGDASGTAAVTLQDFTSSVSGTHTPPAFTATAAITLEDAATTTSGQVGQVGTVAVTLEDTTTTTSGVVGASGAVATTLEDFTAIAFGTTVFPGVAGSAAIVLEDFTSSASGTVVESIQSHVRVFGGNRARVRLANGAWATIRISNGTRLT